MNPGKHACASSARCSELRRCGTLMSFLGTGVPLAPLPVRSMYFFRSVLKYSKTCIAARPN